MKKQTKQLWRSTSFKTVDEIKESVALDTDFKNMGECTRLEVVR